MHTGTVISGKAAVTGVGGHPELSIFDNVLRGGGAAEGDDDPVGADARVAIGPIETVTLEQHIHLHWFHCHLHPREMRRKADELTEKEEEG